MNLKFSRFVGLSSVHLVDDTNLKLINSHNPIAIGYAFNSVI